MKIYMTGGNGVRVESVYVDRDDDKRTFTVTITDARSSYGIEEVVAKYPSVTLLATKNEEQQDTEKFSCTITVTVKISDNANTAKDQMTQFTSALAKLNNNSHSNCFYSREVEFFARQAKMMEEKLFGRTAGNKSQHVSSNEFSSPSAAF